MINETIRFHSLFIRSFLPVITWTIVITVSARNTNYYNAHTSSGQVWKMADLPKPIGTLKKNVVALQKQTYGIFLQFLGPFVFQGTKTGVDYSVHLSGSNHSFHNAMTIQTVKLQYWIAGLQKELSLEDYIVETSVMLQYNKH